MKRLFFIAGLTLCSASSHAAVGDTVNEAGVYIADGISVSSIGTGFLQTDKINSTRFYDSTKGAEWTGAKDSNMCWVHASANIIQYWQSYYGVFAKPQKGTYYDYDASLNTAFPMEGTKPLPYGKIGTTNASFSDSTQIPDSRRLSIARDLYFTIPDNKNHGGRNIGGSFSWAAEWFFRGADQWDDNGTPISLNAGGQAPDTGGYYINYFAEGDFFKENTSYTTTGFTEPVQNTASLKEAVLSGFGIQDGVQHESGKILYISTRNTDSNTGHALTCYGYTTDEAGNIKSLIIADNNAGTGGFSKNSPALTELFIDITDDGKMGLYKDVNCSPGEAFTPSGAGSNYIASISYINTPEVLQNMLAEYSDVNNEAQVWNGASSVWSIQSATTEELPTAATGWDVHVNGENIGTEYHGYYHTYSTDGRDVVFGDRAEQNRSVSIVGTVSAGHIDIAASDYSFTKGSADAAIKEGADMTVRNGASLDSKVQLTLNHLTLEAGAELQASAPIVVTGDFTASAHAARTTVTPPANVLSALDLRGADSLTMQAIVNMNGKDLYLSAEPLKIFINPADAGKAEIVCFTGIGNLYLENRNTENYCLKADVSYVGLDPETLLQYQLMYNQQLRTLTLVQSVPEPTTATLSLLALAALVGRRRRR